VWLVASSDPGVTGSSGGFWLDRRLRPIHRLGRTRRSDTTREREKLWARCCEKTGVELL
jgi:hypothetical protein